jgi:TonB family protein
MGTTAPDLTAEFTAISGGDIRTRAAEDDRRFFRFLAVAVVLHAMMLIRVNTGEPRRLGAEGGADDAISVSIITERDLQGRATVEDTAAGLPVPPPSPPAAQPAPAPEPTPPVEQPRTAEPPAAAPAQPPPAPAPAPESTPTEQPTPPASLRPTLPDEANEPAPKQAEPKPTPEQNDPQKPAEAAAKPAEVTDETAKLLELPEPTPLKKPPEKPAEAKPKPAAPQKPAPKKTETAKLDLTPPAIFQAPVGGGGAGVQRPAGITRSGANDDFARGVIRALQTTMPQLRNTFGRVTVRIELNMNGDLVRTTVLKPSNIAGLDQSVVFATKQSSFPFPPQNAVPADLIFFVTYIYR